MKKEKIVFIILLIYIKKILNIEKLKETVLLNKKNILFNQHILNIWN